MPGSPNGGRRITLGLFVDWLKDPYQNAVFCSIARACAEADVNLLCATGGSLEQPAQFSAQRNILYEMFGPHNVDGLIVLGSNIGSFIGPARLQHYLSRFQPLKSVCIACGLEGIPSVLVDNHAGLRELIEHLIIIHHCQRVAFIRGPSANEEAEQRYAVYREVLAAQKIPFDENLVAQGDFNRLSGATCAHQLLKRGIKFDGLVAANDLMALGALEVLEQRGLRVPDQIAVAGFDDVDEARLAIPQLTTVRQPIHVLGREAVRVALAQIRGEPTEDIIAIASQVVIRRSCGCRANSWDETELIPSSIAPGATLSDVERRFRDAFATLATEGISVNEPAALALFESVFDELDGSCVGKFATMLSNIMRPTAAEGLEAWTRVTDVILRTLYGWTATDSDRRARAEGILQQVRALIGDVAELAQGQQRFVLQRLVLDLSDAAKAITEATTMDALKKALAFHLPLLGITACSLSLYVDPRAPHEYARLEFAYDTQRSELAGRGAELFETRTLAPPGILFAGRRETVVLVPLFFEQDPIGIMSLTMGPRAGVVYECVRDQVSIAIRNLWLLQRVFEETRRRQELEREQAMPERQLTANEPCST